MGVTYINPYRFAAFSPLDLSPALWLDASDTSTITSSGSPAKVSEWRDKSGNARHVSQATSTNQPTTGATTQNGLNVITFDSTDDVLASGSNAPDLTTSTVFVVERHTVAVANRIYEIDGTEGLLIRNTVAPLNCYSYFYTTSLGSTDRQSTANAATSATWRYLTFSNAGTGQNGISMRSNGADMAGSTGQTSAGTRTASTNKVINVGNRLDKARPLDGSIAEFIMYTSVLSGSDISKVETYLAAKWGL